MNLILNILINFVIFQFCASPSEGCHTPGPEEQYYNSHTYLIQPNETSDVVEYLNNFTMNLRISLKNKIETLDNIILTTIPEFCPGGVRGTLEAAKRIPNLINLFVNDFCEFNYATILESGLIFAGRLRLQEEITNVTGNSLELTADDQNPCHETHKYDVKLISQSIINVAGLYEHIINYSSVDSYITDIESINDNSNPLTVLICLGTNIGHFKIDRIIDTVKTRQNSYELSFRKCMDIDKCKEEMKSIRHTLVAILAEKPFTLDYETTIPIVFYNKPFITHEDKAMFPNSISAIRQWNPLIHAFVKFLKIMNWERVAIISDDSEYSEDFETEMSNSLYSEGFAYHSYLCQYKDFECDLNKVMSTLIKVDARIVIVNIGEKNAKKLLDIMNDRSQKIIWLVRDWPFPRDTYFDFRTPQRVFSISLGINNYDISNPQINNAYAGLDTIVSTYKRLFLKYQAYSRKNYYSELIKVERDVINEKGMFAFVTAISSNNVVMTLKINQFNQVSIWKGKDYKITHRDRLPCEIKAESFLEPCGENDFLLLFLVIIVFIICLMIVVYYIYNVKYINSYTNF